MRKDVWVKQTFVFEASNVTECCKIMQADLHAYGQVYIKDKYHVDQ
jgi:hypothetical protein